VLPKYAPPATATAEQLARATPLQVQLADGVELVGYHTGETADTDPDAASRVLPGQRLPVGLYWRASGEPADRQDPRVRLALVDEQGEAVVWHTMWPVPSLSPDVWAPGETYVTRADLRLPAGELPPELSLTVRPVLEGASEQSDDGRVYLERMVTTGGVSQVEPGEAPHTRQEVFASELRLLGHEVSPDVIKPGDSFAIDLYWEVLEKPPADYTVFIHVLDDRDELVTQFDRPAGGGTAPTSTWRTGQTLRDAYPLALPEGIGTGTYTVRMGMYAWPSMERIPVSVEGRALENNLVDLCTLRVGP